MQVRLSGVWYSYPGTSAWALEDVSAAFPQGWTGVVGANGAGKSTVARVACGLLAPQRGSVAPTGLAASYCEQQVLEAPEGAEDFACDYGRDASALRRRLGIGDDWAWRFDTLSAGERKRLQIACALAARPDLLVVDEPTNFLDASSRGQVMEALAGYRGVGLLVSHDRELLDALAERCLFMDGGRAVMRPGGYSAGRAQEELERQSAQARRAQAKRELARLERERQARAEAASRASSSRSLRGADPRDHDAREKRARYVVSGQDGRRGRLAAAMDARVDAAGQAVDEASVAKRYEGDVWLSAEPSPRKAVLRSPAAAADMGEGRRLVVPDLAVGAADHIGVVGDNGAGKTTLVRLLLGRVPEGLRVLYVPQEAGEGEARALLAEARGLPPDERGRALSIVAQLGSDPDALMQGDLTSPGELRKLMLAVGMLGSPELVVMDEPTNHLDILSIEALQRVLAACPCALVLVSHDAPFLAATTSVTWRVERGADGTSRVLVG